ncbi:MAG: hypothetical protein AB1Z98_34315 [Nannocystaceae bacterium]
MLSSWRSSAAGWLPAELQPPPWPEAAPGLVGLGLSSGWLVTFDRRPDAPPLAERLGSAEATTASGRRVVVVRA